MITIMNEPWPGLVSQQIICANTDLDFAILSHIFLFLDGGDYLFFTSHYRHILWISTLRCSVMVLLIKLLVNTVTDLSKDLSLSCGASVAVPSILSHT